MSFTSYKLVTRQKKDAFNVLTIVFRALNPYSYGALAKVRAQLLTFIAAVVYVVVWNIEDRFVTL